MPKSGTPQPWWQELGAMGEQWRGQSVTLVGFWPADADQPVASFTGVVETVTPAGFLLVRPVDDSENPQRQAPLTVRVFVHWAELWGPHAQPLQGRVRYRLPSGAWCVESAGEAGAGWHRGFQAALGAGFKGAGDGGGLLNTSPTPRD